MWGGMFPVLAEWDNAAHCLSLTWGEATTSFPRRVLFAEICVSSLGRSFERVGFFGSDCVLFPDQLGTLVLCTKKWGGDLRTTFLDTLRRVSGGGGGIFFVRLHVEVVSGKSLAYAYNLDVSRLWGPAAVVGGGCCADATVVLEERVAGLVGRVRGLEAEVSGLREDKRRMEGLVQRYVEGEECLLCLDQRRGVVLVPCNHMVVCTLCAPAVGEACPLCCGEVCGVIRIVR
eukprot:860226-Rhodomonas_salina.1